MPDTLPAHAISDGALLPCPFCGSVNINNQGPCYTQIMCNDCGAAEYDQPSRAEAIAAWNRRPDLLAARKAEPVKGFLVRNEAAGFTEFVTEDVPALSGQIRAANVEPIIRLGSPRGEPIGFRIYDDTPASTAGVSEEAICDCCGRPALTWFAPNKLWNFVIGGPDAKDDPGGMLCPNCFIEKAEAAGIQPTAWVISQEDLEAEAALEAALAAAPSLPDEPLQAGGEGE